jgi:hypothetical protein
VVHFPAEEREFLFSKESTLALRPNQPPLQWAAEALSFAVKQLPSNDEVKNVWRYISTLPCLFMVWCSRDKFSSCVSYYCYMYACSPARLVLYFSIQITNKVPPLPPSLP